MTFSPAQYTAATEKVKSKNQEIGAKIKEVGPAATAAMNQWYIPDFVADAIKWCADKIVELATWIWEKITECLKGLSMPIYMFEYSMDWQDIRGTATGVSGQLQTEALNVDERWQGSAADAYKKAITPQSDAAKQIGSVSEKTANALALCAGAGLLFYISLGVIVVKFVVAMVGAIAALGSAVFSWAGAALIVEEAGVNSGLIIAAVTALGSALAIQAHQMTVLHGEATDNTHFPGGKWPNPTNAGNYKDATVKDGDADWSIKT